METGKVLHILQERERERKRFVQNLKDRIHDAEKEFGRQAMVSDLIIVIVQWLRGRGKEAVTKPIEALVSGPVSTFFKNELLPAIEAFSPAPEEQDMIARKLFEHLSQQLCAIFDDAFRGLVTVRREKFLEKIGKLAVSPVS